MTLPPTARLAALHGARLLSDDELFAIEDAIADHVEFEASVTSLLSFLAEKSYRLKI